MENQPTTAEGQSRLVRNVLAEGAQRLGEAGIESARLDAEVLLGHALGVEKAQLYLHSHAELGAKEVERFSEYVRRRSEHEPVAYITGQKEFWSLDFVVTPQVLIPRPETERVVEIALELKKNFSAESPLTILDIGTGSGALAVCLAKEMPSARIWAVEVSPAALAVARKNCERHGVENRIHLLPGNLFEPVAGLGLLFDLIVSNPPYIRRGELSNLASDVRDWEPLQALDGGADGLDYYREIIIGAHGYLHPEGIIMLEIGGDIGESVAQLIARVGGYAAVSIHRDYGGKERVIVTRKIISPTVGSGGKGRG